MRERALNWTLRIIGLVLAIVPIVAAFAVSGWDLQATIMPNTGHIQDTISQNVMENMLKVGNFQLLENLDSFDPTAHYVISWEQAELRLVTDLGHVLGYTGLGNAGARTGHAPTYNLLGEIGCKGCSTPDLDNADPSKDCVSPNDGNVPVFKFNVSTVTFSSPLPMTIPGIIGRDDPTNAIVVRSSIEQIGQAFTNAGWEFYYPCEGYASPEPHTPLGEVADAFLNETSTQYHVRIFYGGNDATYGEWYYMGAHFEGQNAVPSVGAPVTLRNPFSFPLRVENFTAEIYCSQDNYPIGVGRLDQQRTVPAGGTDTFNILMGFTYDGFSHLYSEHLSGTTIDTTMRVVGEFRFKIYGISIVVRVEQSMAFPTDIKVGI